MIDKKRSGDAQQNVGHAGEGGASNKQLPWFRVYHEIIDDDKLGLLAFEDRWHYVALLACKRRGLLDKADKPELMMRRIALKLGLSVTALDEVARRLSEVGLIERLTLQPLAWESRQMRSDNDPTAADRKRRQREKSKEKGKSRVTGTDVTRTEEDTDIDTEEEENNTGDAGGDEPVAETPDELFARFWKAYPRRVAKDSARKAFDKRKPDSAMVDLMVKAIAVQAKLLGWTKDREQFIPHPASWLNAGRWMDEFDDCEGGSVDAKGKAVPVNSQQRTFGNANYGDSQVPDFLLDEAEAEGARA